MACVRRRDAETSRRRTGIVRLAAHGGPVFGHRRRAGAWGQQLAVMSKLLSLAVKRLSAWRDSVVTCAMFGALGSGPLTVTSSALSRAVAVNAQSLLSSVSVLVLPFALSAEASNVTLYVPSLTRFTLPSESRRTAAELVLSLLDTRTFSCGSARSLSITDSWTTS